MPQDDSEEAVSAVRKRSWKKRLWLTLAVLLVVGGITAMFEHYRERRALRANAAKVELGDGRSEVEAALGEPSSAFAIPDGPILATYGTSTNHFRIHLAAWINGMCRLSGLKPHMPRSRGLPMPKHWPVVIEYNDWEPGGRVIYIRRFGEEVSSKAD